uniref:Filamin C n=1 Tax=Pseudonaja textilis TaxID=8673 RepID=A0A670Z8K0_PSETE
MSGFRVKKKVTSLGTSTVLVETVTKATSSVGGSYSALPKFSSDASKVVARGPGLSKAFVGQKNTFTVDCSKAGTNMLMVGVHGPKTPCDEVYVKHMGNRVYSVTYTVKEKGDYILIVKWGDEGVPGRCSAGQRGRSRKRERKGSRSRDGGCSQDVGIFAPGSFSTTTAGVCEGG